MTVNWKLSDDFPAESNEFIRALHALHVASPKGYAPPQEVAAATKAKYDLVTRVRAKGWSWSRDERRLADRYEGVEQTHRDQVLADYRSSRAASDFRNGADT